MKKEELQSRIHYRMIILGATIRYTGGGVRRNYEIDKFLLKIVKKYLRPSSIIYIPLLIM